MGHLIGSYVDFDIHALIFYLYILIETALVARVYFQVQVSSYIVVNINCWK